MALSDCNYFKCLYTVSFGASFVTAFLPFTIMMSSGNVICLIDEHICIFDVSMSNQSSVKASQADPPVAVFTLSD